MNKDVDLGILQITSKSLLVKDIDVALNIEPRNAVRKGKSCVWSIDSSGLGLEDISDPNIHINYFIKLLEKKISVIQEMVSSGKVDVRLLWIPKNIIDEKSIKSFTLNADSMSFLSTNSIEFIAYY